MHVFMCVCPSVYFFFYLTSLIMWGLSSSPFTLLFANHQLILVTRWGILIFLYMYFNLSSFSPWPISLCLCLCLSICLSVFFLFVCILAVLSLILSLPLSIPHYLPKVEYT